MAASETLRVVSKAQYNQQTFISIPTLMTPLAPSSVRVQTKLLALTSNNLAYCAAGDLLHWWSSFPLPPTTPDPYNDPQNYGIAPGWGFCQVTESTIPDIELGRVIYGFIPISSHTVDLQLRQVEDMPNHWIETSAHRSKVMNIYQRYILFPPGFSLSNRTPLILLTPVLRPVWEAGYLLAKYVFSQTSPSIHPFGVPVSPWTEKQADLTDSCVVCIAAGTKTSRSFLHQLAMIDAGKQAKYSVIEVTGGVTGCETYMKNPPFQHMLLNYAQVCPDAFKHHNHRKWVLLNFGGRDNALSKVAEAIEQSDQTAELLIVQIGGEARVASKEELTTRRETVAALKAVQMNTAAIRDEAMKRVGEIGYFEELEGAFEALVLEQVGEYGGRVLGVKIVEAQGLQGYDGVEGWWKRLAGGLVSGDDGVVVSLRT